MAFLRECTRADVGDRCNAQLRQRHDLRAASCTQLPYGMLCLLCKRSLLQCCLCFQTTAAVVRCHKLAQHSCAATGAVAHLVLRASRHLKITVDVGFVVGTIPAGAAENVQGITLSMQYLQNNI